MIDLNSARSSAFQHLLAGLDRGIDVRLNRNRHTLLSFRWSSGWKLSLHESFLDDSAAMQEIAEWIRKRGRGKYPTIASAMRRIVEERRTQESAQRGPISFPDLQTVTAPLDLDAAFHNIYATWFAHLPKPEIRWSRGGLHRSQRHIRFGCYRRKPRPTISLHPRLNQPWIARAFVDHVIFHELCHHAQACSPVRGETAHSRRFRAWERNFPLHDRVREWEKAHLDRLLGMTPRSA